MSKHPDALCFYCQIAKPIDISFSLILFDGSTCALQSKLFYILFLNPEKKNSINFNEFNEKLVRGERWFYANEKHHSYCFLLILALSMTIATLNKYLIITLSIIFSIRNIANQYFF